MDLWHDVVFKRNFHGYVEEARVQLWRVYVRQVPMWIVYHPHNNEDDIQHIKEHGLYFMSPKTVLEHIARFYHSFQMDTECVVLRDLCQDSIDAMRKAKPNPDGLMYRVVYSNPMAELPLCAIGHGLYDLDEPRLVNAETADIGRWCIYNLGNARAVALMNSSNLFKSYLNDRLRNNPDGGSFLIQSTLYNEDGNPKEGEHWMVVDEFPHVIKPPMIEFTDDLSDIQARIDLG